MARYSKADWRPLASGHQPTMARHDIICLHTMVGYLTSTDAMFKRNGWDGTESHFGVGGKWGSDRDADLDGKIYQWGDTKYVAHANLAGNHRIISIETADNAPATVEAIAEWTPKQLDAIVKLVAWACETHDIPPVLVADSKPNRRGIAYHRQGCEHSLGVGRVPGYLVAGGERWSSSLGKGCPGPRRIAQLKTIVIPRVRTALNPPKPKPIVPKPPKEPTVANVTEDMQITLTSDYQVELMNSNNAPDADPWKKGDVLNFNRLAKWGGPASERLLNLVLALVANLDDQEKAREDTATSLERIEGALAEITAKLTPPTPTGESRSV